MNFLIFEKLRKKSYSTFLIQLTITLFLYHIFHIDLINCFFLDKSNNSKHLENFIDQPNYYIPTCNICFNCSICIHENETSEYIIPMMAVSSKRKHFNDKFHTTKSVNSEYKIREKEKRFRKVDGYGKDNFFLVDKLKNTKKSTNSFLEENNDMPPVVSNKTTTNSSIESIIDNNINLEINEEQDYVNNQTVDNKDDKIYINEKNDDTSKHDTPLNDQVTLPLQQLQDSQYVGYIQIGNPPQTIRPIFDTGSTNIWIVSTKCNDDTCLKVHRYNYKLSKSFRYYEPHTNLDIMFGTGIIQGIIGMETFRIGPFKIENQSFGLVKREKSNGKKSNVFERINFEGIIGLAFPAMLSTGKRAIYQNLMSSYKFKHNEFSIYIGRDNKSSALIFGGVDKRFFEGNIYMFPVVREYYWEIQFDGLYIDHQKFCCDSNSIVYDLRRKSKNRNTLFIRKFFKKISKFRNEQLEEEIAYRNSTDIQRSKNYLIFDSGTSFNSVPKSEIKYFFKIVPPKPCNDENLDQVVSSYPNLTYVINNMPFTLTPPQYLVRNDSTCKPAFMEIEVSPEFGHAYILGNATFMKYYYTVYRSGNGNENSYVGIAKAIHANENDEYLSSLHRKYNKV